MQDATDLGEGHAAGSSAPELPVGTLLSHYRIDGVLGRGGMGVVYRATDTKLDRPVAIKFLALDLADARAKERFRQEAHTASSLSHPHIVTVHDVGEHDGRQFIVSELVDGGTLDDWSSATRRGWRQCVELVTGVADAVAAAHKAGVLHRDIKPGNILIGSNGYAKLADFGLAKLVGTDAQRPPGSTQQGVIVGTVAYMSPEQATGQPLDERSDVFSFGIVLYELLAGRRPFDGVNDLETLKGIVHASPPPLPEGVPELLRMAVDKALEKDPADRHQTMRDLVADLRRAARKSTSSQSAMQASADSRSLGFFVRYRPAVLAALALAAAGAVYVYALRPNPTASSAAATGGTAPPYEITRLTTSGNAIAPAIAPDGRYIAYVQSHESTGATSLWVRQVATPGNVLVVASEAGEWIGLPTVTPDGDYVDFVRGEFRSNAWDLWRVPFLGGTPTLVIRNVYSPVGWSPDGKQMAFIRWSSDASQLIVADANGGGERVIATRRLPSLFVAYTSVGRPLVRPAWSPDGKTIGVFAVDERRVRVALVDVATGEEANRLAGVGLPHGIAWLGPAQLVVSQGRESPFRNQLLRVSYPDGALSLMTNDLDDYMGLDVDASRRNLVTSRRETTTSLWVGDALGANARRIVAPSLSSGTLLLPTLSWAGERVIIERVVDGPPTVIAVHRDGRSEDLVPAAIEGVVSANGRTLVFTRDIALWKTDGVGAQPVQLTAGMVVADPRVTPDGRYVVFLSTRDGTQAPWLVSTEGGEPTQLARVHIGLVGRIDISPDGRRLMFISRETDGAPERVSLCDLPSCSDRTEIDAPESFRVPFRFMPDGKSIAYLDQTGTNLWALPLDGGAPRQITSFPEGAVGGAIANYAWSSDGTRLAFLRRTVAEDIVLFRGVQP
jgi:Tol biopolymer transport system component